MGFASPHGENRKFGLPAQRTARIFGCHSAAALFLAYNNFTACLRGAFTVSPLLVFI